MNIYNIYNICKIYIEYNIYSTPYLKNRAARGVVFGQFCHPPAGELR